MRGSNLGIIDQRGTPDVIAIPVAIAIRSRPLRHARGTLRQARQGRHGAGLEQADAVAVAGAAQDLRAGALEIRARPRRARCRRPADQHRARRTAQPHPVQPGRGQHLRHRAHAGRGLSDDHAGGMGAGAPAYAECAAPHPRRRARHLHRGRRRQHRHGAGRRAADAELVDPRPRQSQQGLRLLARLPRCAAGATPGADVLRSRRGRTSARRRAGHDTRPGAGIGHDRLTVRVHLQGHLAPARRGRSPSRAGRSPPRSSWAIPRSPPRRSI